MSVVLPAPLGPIMACSSPAPTLSETSSVTRMPPKFLRKDVSSSVNSATTLSPREPGPDVANAVGESQDDDDQQQAEHDPPVVRKAGQPFFACQEDDGPDDCSRQCP